MPYLSEPDYDLELLKLNSFISREHYAMETIHLILTDTRLPKMDIILLTVVA